MKASCYAEEAGFCLADAIIGAQERNRFFPV